MEIKKHIYSVKKSFVIDGVVFSAIALSIYGMGLYFLEKLFTRFPTLAPEVQEYFIMQYQQFALICASVLIFYKVFSTFSLLSINLVHLNLFEQVISKLNSFKSPKSSQENIDFFHKKQIFSEFFNSILYFALFIKQHESKDPAAFIPGIDDEINTDPLVGQDDTHVA